MDPYLHRAKRIVTVWYLGNGNREPQAKTSHYLPIQTNGNLYTTARSLWCPTLMAF